MPPYRNPVEARRKKDRPVQKVADENCYMSSAEFDEKYHSARQGHLRDGDAAPASQAGNAGHGAGYEASVAQHHAVNRICHTTRFPVRSQCLDRALTRVTHNPALA